MPFRLSALQDGEVNRVLDIGTGEGSFILAVAEQRPDIKFIAIDHNDSLIKSAMRAHSASGLNDLCFQQALFDENFEEDNFDVIFMRFCLEHVEEPLDILSEVYRRLKPGGRIGMIDEYWFDSGIGDPVWERFRQEMLKTFERVSANPYIPRYLNGWLQSVGFKAINSKLAMYSPATIGIEPFSGLLLDLPVILNGLHPDTWQGDFIDELEQWLEQRVRPGYIDPFVSFAHVVAEKPLQACC